MLYVVVTISRENEPEAETLGDGFDACYIVKRSVLGTDWKRDRWEGEKSVHISMMFGGNVAALS